MRRQVRMTVFHVRQFVSVPYFIQLMVMTTTSTTLVQFLAASAWGGITPTQGWVRGGVVGMWTTTTCAAGIIGFERYKGTLVHLVMAPVGALRSLAAVVCAAASFGLVAFPVAWCTWALLSTSVSFTGPGWEVWTRLAAGALMLLGVFQEVHTRRRLDVAYWLSVAVVPALLAASTATVAIGVVFALSPLHDVGALGRVITVAAPTIVCGLLMGIMAAGVGVNLPDPYLGATIIATFLPLLTGVIVPLEQCPTWLQALAHLVPVSGTLTVLDAPAAAVPALLGRDLAVAVVWAGIGLAVTRRAVTRLRQGQRTDTI